MAGIAAKITIAALVVIGIFLGLLAYSYTQIHVSLNDVSFHSIEWSSFSWTTMLKLGLNVLTGNWLGAAFDLIQGINLDLTFGLHNGGILPVYIPDLSYDLYVNDVSMGQGYSQLDLVVNPGETKEVNVLQNFKKNSFAPAVGSIVYNEGVMEIRVKGTAYFNLLGFNIPIPFESTKHISIIDEVKQRLNSEIQKNRQQPSNSAGSTISKSIGSAVESITKEMFGGPERPSLDMDGQTIADSVYSVPPGSYYPVKFTLQCNAYVQGGFSASATLGDNIVVYVLDEYGFRDYENDESFSTYYNSGKIESDTFDLYLNPGTYYVVMSNTYSVFSTKDVALRVIGVCS